MKYLAAYLLLIEGGNTSPSTADISALLETVGAEVEEARVSTLMKDLEGKNVADLIAEGQTKLASVPSAGAGAASSGAAGAGAGAGDAGAAAEEEKEEEKEESDEDMGMGLFD